MSETKQAETRAGARTMPPQEAQKLFDDLMARVRQETAKEIAQFIADQGVARTDNLLYALASRIREKYEVK